MKSVIIQIANADLELLRRNRYSLCFAKQMSDTFGVVWQCYPIYLSANEFSWTSSYQLFGAKTFSPGRSVAVDTNLVDIALGQQSTLDATGHLEPAVQGGPPDSITMVNNRGPIYPGLSGLSAGLDGVQRMTPIFMVPIAIATGGVGVLTPTENLLVWFQQNIDAGTIFSQPAPGAVKIDLAGVDTATRRYQNGSWLDPASESAGHSHA
ncbi:hypothetical protein V1282_006233 [Nitrobacteraceae bacterium AZCC 2146]